MTDWSSGEYERTATALEPAAEAVVAAAAPAGGERVLDVACGTGNASALAAAAGSTVTGVDLAERLLGVARTRVPEGTFLTGDAAALPLPEDAFDVAVSVFGVIFAEPGEAAAAELRRVVRPGGRIALATWLPEGTIFEVAKLMRATSGEPPTGHTTPVQWHDRETLERLFAGPVGIERHVLPFTGTSPEAWWDEQVEHHPMWMAGGEPVVALRDQALEVLHAGNADPAALRLDSPYVVVTATT